MRFWNILFLCIHKLQNLKNQPICVKCRHFIPPPNTHYPYEDPESDNFGKCKLFGKQNLVTGQVEYVYADTSRSSSSLCSENGTYFETTNITKE